MMEGLKSVFLSRRKPKFRKIDWGSTISQERGDGKEEEGSLQPGQLSSAEDTSSGMGRHLGLLDTTLLIIGRIVGTGIFSTPSSIVESVGSVGAALLLWVLGALLSFAGLCVWLELGCLFPRSGGEKVYLEAVYKKPKLLATVIFSTQAVLLGFTAGGCIVFASNILVAAGRQVTAWNERGIAVGVIIFVTLIHTFTPRIGVFLQNALSSIKILVLLFIVITGFVVLSNGSPKIQHPHASFQNAFSGSVTSSGPYATALFKVINSYAGWNNAAYVLNEVKSPIRTLKIVGPLALSTCAILYLLANIAYFSAATPSEIAASGTTVASYFALKVFGPSMQKALSVFVALSALGNVFTVTFAQSRVNQELAKEGVLPFGRFWASSYPTGAPGAGLLLHSIPSFVVIIAIPAGDAYTFIIDVEGYPTSVINLFVVIAFFILRHRQPDLHRPFKTWIIEPVFFLAAQCFLLVAPFLRPPGGKGDTKLPYWLYPIVGIVVLVFGAAGWVVWRVVLPRAGGFRWVEKKDVLRDGTVVKGWVREKRE